MRNVCYNPQTRMLRFDIEEVMFLMKAEATYIENKVLVSFCDNFLVRHTTNPNSQVEKWNFVYDTGKRMIMRPLLPEKASNPEWDADRITLSQIVSILYDMNQVVSKQYVKKA